MVKIKGFFRALGVVLVLLIGGTIVTVGIPFLVVVCSFMFSKLIFAGVAGIIGVMVYKETTDKSN